MMVNALTVDVEEYYHAAIFRNGTRTLTGSRFESRVEQTVDRLLALLSRHQTKATFFVLGEVAASHPSVVRKIAAERHEIACHGNQHEDVYRRSPAEFRRDIRRAKARIEDLAGDGVLGYRAPNFSIRTAQSWAYEILLEEGFRYDSSTYPILHDRYGEPNAPRFPYEIWRDGSASLVEFPVATARLFGVNLPIGGGGFFRLLPFTAILLGIQYVNHQEHQPIMFYLHPWELDPDQPRPPMPWHHRFRHYVGLAKEADKLSRLLTWLRFGTAREVLEDRGPLAAARRPVSIAAPQHSFSS